MNPTNRTSQPHITSLAWIYITAPNLEPFWARTTHILPMQSQYDVDRADTLRLLKEGKTYVDQKSKLQLQSVVMPASIIKRLDYLLGLETGGFRLSSFRTRTALYTHARNDIAYLSMREMLERGYMPKAFIALSRTNVAVYLPNRKLLDVFVPVSAMTQYFTLR